MLATAVAHELLHDADRWRRVFRRYAALAAVMTAAACCVAAARTTASYAIALVALPALLSTWWFAGEALWHRRIIRRWLKEELARAVLVDACSPFDSVTIDALLARFAYEPGGRSFNRTQFSRAVVSMLEDHALGLDVESGGVRLMCDLPVQYTAPWAREGRSGARFSYWNLKYGPDALKTPDLTP